MHSQEYNELDKQRRSLVKRTLKLHVGICFVESLRKSCVFCFYYRVWRVAAR